MSSSLTAAAPSASSSSSQSVASPSPAPAPSPSIVDGIIVNGIGNLAPSPSRTRPPPSTMNTPTPTASAPPPLLSPTVQAPPPPVSSSPPPPPPPAALSPPPPNMQSSPPPPPPAASSPPPPNIQSSPPPPANVTPPPDILPPSPPPPPLSPPPSPPTRSPQSLPPPPLASSPSPPPPPPPRPIPTFPSSQFPSSNDQLSPSQPFVIPSRSPPFPRVVPTAPTPPSPSSVIPTGAIIAIVASAFAIVILAVAATLIFWCLCKKRKRLVSHHSDAHKDSSYHYSDHLRLHGRSPSSNSGSDTVVKVAPLPSTSDPLPSMRFAYRNHGLYDDKAATGSPGSISWFTYEELAIASDGFSRSNLLGEGGFGCVFKGILADGQTVAIKQLKVGGEQGEKEFQAEVETISRVHHRHLVSLVGYCIAEKQRLLVYDYVPNGALEYHLHCKKGGPTMNWKTRLKIAIGSARGVAYLHEDCHPRIIHRDIKSSNILLDNNYEALVSDFGLAKLTPDAITHVTTRVMGTFGYLAPEYASSGKLTEKSDVYSFGVLLLELVTGRKPVDLSQPAGEESLVEWARPLLAQIGSEEALKLLADPSLDGSCEPKEMLRMVEAAAACVRHSANNRPRMGQVVRALEDDDASLSDLNKGIKPGLSSMNDSSTSASTDQENANYDASAVRRLGVSSQEYGSSEYSGDTSDYGPYPSASSSEYQTSREVDRRYTSKAF